LQFVPALKGRAKFTRRYAVNTRLDKSAPTQKQGHQSEVIMKLLLPVLLLLATVSFATLSQSNSPQAPVEIKGEAHHHPKFENDFVRIWDVTVPGGEATLWHIHRNDNVVITLAGANLRLENASGAPVEAQWKFGDVRFAKATYTHRAINIGVTPFHNLTIELLNPSASAFQDSAPPNEAGRAPVFENDRVRAYRLSLAPGEVIGTHTHPFPGVVVTLTAGEIEVTADGKSVRHPVKENDVSWRAGGVTHSIRNVGKTTFEAVDIELKYLSAKVSPGYIPRGIFLGIFPLRPLLACSTLPPASV
jgi:quercetin dioxygenase-like cupin family protein